MEVKFTSVLPNNEMTRKPFSECHVPNFGQRNKWNEILVFIYVSFEGLGQTDVHRKFFSLRYRVLP